MESMNYFGAVLSVTLQVGCAIYGAVVAAGLHRLRSPFSLVPIDCRLSRITGFVLLAGQLVGLMLVWITREPSAMLALVPFALSAPLAWAIDRLLPDRETRRGEAPR